MISLAELNSNVGAGVEVTGNQYADAACAAA
jgi:hypothetical protein